VDEDEEDAAGAAFRGLAEEFDLVLPATLQDCVLASELRGWTWQSTAGRQHRIDFIGIPAGWASSAHGASVLPLEISIDTFQDHRPVEVTVQLACARQAKRPGPWFSKVALRSPAGKAALELAWWSVPPLPLRWAVDVQAWAFAKLHRLLLAHFCPPAKSEPVKQWLTGDTWWLVRYRQRLSCQFHLEGRLLRAMLLRDVVSAWRGARLQAPWACSDDEVEAARRAHERRAWLANLLPAAASKVRKATTKTAGVRSSCQEPPCRPPVATPVPCGGWSERCPAANGECGLRRPWCSSGPTAR
jgi:hypothetical protein